MHVLRVLQYSTVLWRLQLEFEYRVQGCSLLVLWFVQRCSALRLLLSYCVLIVVQHSDQ